MASRLFERTFADRASPHQTCGFCGIIHFCPTSMDNDELKKINAYRKSNPYQYVEHTWDRISWGMVDDKVFVPDCGCGKADGYEEFIWSHRRLIVEYIRTRLKDRFSQTQTELEMVKGV